MTEPLNLFTHHDVSLPDITFKHKLKHHNHYYGLVNKISALIQQIPEYGRDNIRCELELIRTACNIIENSSIPKNNKKTLKIDKKKLVIDALHKVFVYSDVEKNIVGNIIDFLFNNGFIKKLSYYKLIKNFTLKLIKVK
jgi:hypothetical protein